MTKDHPTTGVILLSCYPLNIKQPSVLKIFWCFEPFEPVAEFGCKGIRQHN
jgi:hypothetical protein